MQGIGLSGYLNSYVYTLIVKHCLTKFKNLSLELAGTKFPGGNVPKMISGLSCKYSNQNQFRNFPCRHTLDTSRLVRQLVYSLLRCGWLVRHPVLREEPGQMPRNIPVHRPKARTASTPSFFQRPTAWLSSTSHSSAAKEMEHFAVSRPRR